MKDVLHVKCAAEGEPVTGTTFLNVTHELGSGKMTSCAGLHLILGSSDLAQAITAWARQCSISPLGQSYLCAVVAAGVDGELYDLTALGEAGLAQMRREGRLE